MISNTSLLIAGLSLVSLFSIVIGWVSIKKDKTKKILISVLAVIGIVAGIPVLGAPDIIGNLVGGQPALSVGGSSDTGGQGSVPSVSLAGAGVSSETNKCPANRQSTMRISLQDELASTNTYVSGSTIYLFDGINNPERLTATSGATGYDANVTVSCPQEYSVTAVSQAGVIGGTSATRTTSIPTEFVELKAARIAPLQFRVKDISTDTFQTWVDDGQATGNNGTNYTTMNDTQVFANVGGSDIAIGVDGFLDTKIFFKTITNRRVAGEKLPFDICFDLNQGSSSGSSNWQEPTVTYLGQKLVDVKSSIDPDSLAGALISQTENCYKLTDDGSTIGDSDKELNVRFSAKAGANPTTTDDIEVQFLPVGRYYSNKKTNLIKEGIYDDQATGVLVVPAANRRPAFTINIA